MTTKFKKHHKGCYRLSLTDGMFIQIRRYRQTPVSFFNPEYKPDSTGREWGVEVRNESGSIIRYAGFWPTLKEAKEEALHVASQI